MPRHEIRGSVSRGGPLLVVIHGPKLVGSLFHLSSDDTTFFDVVREQMSDVD